MRVLVFAQQAAGQERNDEHGDQQRADDGGDDRHRQHPDELARISRQRHQRHESENQGCGAAHHGDEDLPGAGQRRLGTRGAFAKMARNVLGDHDRVVDQQAQSHHEGGDGDLVQRIVEEVDDREAEGKRQRNRDHHDAGGTQSQGQQGQQHQRDGDQQVAKQVIEPVGHIARLFESHLELDAPRQAV